MNNLSAETTLPDPETGGEASAFKSLVFILLGISSIGISVVVLMNIMPVLAHLVLAAPSGTVMVIGFAALFLAGLILVGGIYLVLKGLGLKKKTAVGLVESKKNRTLRVIWYVILAAMVSNVSATIYLMATFLADNNSTAQPSVIAYIYGAVSFWLSLGAYSFVFLKYENLNQKIKYSAVLFTVLTILPSLLILLGKYFSENYIF